MKRSTIPLTVVMVVAMVVSTFQLFTIAVLASDIIEEFNLTRGDIGWLGAANTGVGAVLAPRLGRLTDYLGPKLSTVLVFLTSGAGIALTGAATSFLMLIVASFLCGIPQGWSNSATNKLIAVRLGAAERGLVIGFKQSGVQLAIFLAGLGMPAFGADWQSGLIAIGIACIVAGGVAWVVLGPETNEQPVATGASGVAASKEPLPVFVYQVTAYALLLGLAAGGIGRFLPLFAKERLGFSVAAAGAVVAFQGIVGILARLLWGRAAESSVPLRGSLFVMAVGGICAIGMMLAAETIGGWILYPMAVLQAFTLSAWNVVANLAMIKSVPSQLSGRATGVMMLAFLAGLTISSPLVGWIVDATGNYQTAWWTMLAFAGLGAASVAREIPGSKVPR